MYRTSSYHPSDQHVYATMSLDCCWGSQRCDTTFAVVFQ